MRVIRTAFLLAALLAVGATAHATPARPVQAGADARNGKIGHPVTLTLRAPVQAGDVVLWHLADGVVANRGAILLEVRTQALAAAVIQHQIVFTTAQGGRYRLGPFPVLMQRGQQLDTLYAPAIMVRFQAEPLRPALHAIKPLVPAWEGVPTGQKGALLAAGFLLIGLLVAAWRLLRTQPLRAVAAPAPSAEQARRLALDKIEALESQAKSSADERMADEILSIVREYLESLPMAGGGDAAGPDAALADLNKMRFSPARADAREQARLLKMAKQLLRRVGETEQPAG